MDTRPEVPNRPTGPLRAVGEAPKLACLDPLGGLLLGRPAGAAGTELVAPTALIKAPLAPRPGRPRGA